ncbi:DnaB-like helicase C-terminal domain-containing protein [Clostridium paraputrificum]|uniref:DnaB-like helicase C-terminal domain-containing protein n=1 Tax=Clostridium paraputrificum TaxID=29363 RepID=UPI0012B74F7C|nr:DnaB-like helicase C-terminal domain-containing protein [Clostridium paraputrificum]
MDKFNLQIEKVLLGSSMWSKRILVKLLDKGVVEEDFYSSKYRIVFNALVKCYADKNSTDILIVSKECAKNGVLASEVTDIYQSGNEGYDINALINELLDLRIVRERIRLADDIRSGVLSTDEEIKKRFDSIEFIKSKIGNENTITTLDKVSIVDVYKMDKIPTGFREIDCKLLGFAMGSLNIITGYNGNGKSTLINQMCIAESIARGYKVFAYSPELTNSNFKSWLYPTIADKDHFVEKEYRAVKYKYVGDIGIKYIDSWIKDKLFLYTDDSITHDEKQLLTDMKQLAENKGVKVFIIDNLMKIELEGSYKNELISQRRFVNRLKEFARRYGAVVHLVAHPKKPNENNKKIGKFDIAGSGDITNLADYVMSISRVSEEDREKIPILKDSVIKVMKDRIKGNSEFAINLEFDRVRKRFYSSQFELNKDYGYTKGRDLIQVELLQRSDVDA